MEPNGIAAQANQIPLNIGHSGNLLVLMSPFSACGAVASKSLCSYKYLQLDTTLCLDFKTVQQQTTKLGVLNRLKSYFKQQKPKGEELPRGWAVAFGILLVLYGTLSMLVGIFMAILSFIGFFQVPIIIGVLVALLASIGGIALGALGFKLLFPKMPRKKRWLLSIVMNVAVALVLYSLAWANGVF